MASIEKPAAEGITTGRQRVVDFIANHKHECAKGLDEAYDQWATSYDQDHKHYQGPSIISSELIQLITDRDGRKDLSILDCGSGTGLIGEGLNASGFTNITAMDISQESLDIAEEKGVYKKVIRVDPEDRKLPFEDNTFDALVSSGSVVPNHISPTAFYEWVRIVKSGGIIIFSIRRCYLEVTKANEDLYSKSFKDDLSKVLEDLEQTAKLKLIFKKDFPEYLEHWSAVLFGAKVM